ncbi:MAG: serine hydrolase domain-containing protein [Stackebrandtia sp.]
MRKKLLIAAGAAAGLIGLTAVPYAALAENTEPASSESKADVELLERKLDALHEAAGPASVAVEVNDGDQVWTEARGDRDPDSGTPTEPTDRVRVASLTKSMVSTVLLQLVEEGELELDDPVDEYLPGVLPYEETITVRQLLNHTSGLHDYFKYIYKTLDDVREKREQEFTVEEIIEIGTQEPLLFAPGEGFSYSNTGYYVLGLLVEELTGDSLDAQLQERVFDVVGMDDTYVPTEPTIDGPHPHAYFATGDDADPYIDTTKLSPTQMWAAGAVVSNQSDVDDFYRAHSDGTLLSPEMLEEARTVSDPSLDQMPYGLGLTRFDVPDGCEAMPGGHAWGHTGGGLGFSTYSFHSADGERQVSFTWTLDAQAVSDHPAYQAAYELLLAGMCDLDAGDGAVDAQSADQLADLMRNETVVLD